MASYYAEQKGISEFTAVDPIRWRNGVIVSAGLGELCVVEFGWKCPSTSHGEEVM